MRLPLFLLTVIICACSYASDLKIDGIEWIKGSNNKVKFTVAWNNSWRNEKNYDAAWIFFKLPASDHQPLYNHVKILPTGHRMLSNLQPGSPKPAFEVTKDGVGFYVYPSEKYRGNVRWTIEIALDPKITRDQLVSRGSMSITAYGIEMVQIPQAAFTIGEADTALARKNYSFFLSDENGKPSGLWKINSESESIPIGREKGKLYYNSQVAQYHGDQKGIVPPEFPKGYKAFYIMKYETTQGQYCNFLNGISEEGTKARSNFNEKDYYKFRGSIKLENGKYIAGSPNRPCNFFSWDDACAFADWAGLRPMTELEFEKACRGPLTPIPHEFPWNTNNKDRLQRIVSLNDDLILKGELKEGDLNENNRDQFGASYYWVMDLAGSLWERCVTIGDATGRAFKGTHGDGKITANGFASNDDWPRGSTETSGFGFKGGGYYEHTMRVSEFNPHGPIGYRNFGSWPGGMRSLAYGSRFVRSRD